MTVKHGSVEKTAGHCLVSVSQGMTKFMVNVQVFNQFRSSDRALTKNSAKGEGPLI